MIEFNLNNHVWVKLTDVGRERLHKNYDRLMSLYGTDRPPYEPPKEDADGWSKWQMWCLMSELGGMMHNGCNVPFETTIRIDFKHEQRAEESGKG
ncbi:hypothetical protein KAR91_54410 [Candidatus Pacearchaeota archaeon]|nr:hypothetical protein [Candidatus Pacearchaeota archaeon]